MRSLIFAANPVKSRDYKNVDSVDNVDNKTGAKLSSSFKRQVFLVKKRSKDQKIFSRKMQKKSTLNFSIHRQFNVDNVDNYLFKQVFAHLVYISGTHSYQQVIVYAFFG